MRPPRAPAAAATALARLTSPHDLHRVLRRALERGPSPAGGLEPSSSEAPPLVQVGHLPQITEDTRFLSEAFRLILDRPPDPEGWIAFRRLLALGFPKTLIVHELATTAEARKAGRAFDGVWYPRPVAEILAHDGVAFVREAFRSVLWREADGASLRSYADQVRQGRSRREILREIARSAEAELLPREAEGLDALIRESPPVDLGFLEETGESLVRGAYRVVLFREPEPGGLAHWMAALSGGLQARDLVMGLLDSEEAREGAAAEPGRAAVHDELRAVVAAEPADASGGDDPSPPGG